MAKKSALHFTRPLLLTCLGVLEIWLAVTVISGLAGIYHWLGIAAHLAAVVLALLILKDSTQLSADVPWLVLILAIPVPGVVLFLMAFLNTRKGRFASRQIAQARNRGTWLQADFPEALADNAEAVYLQKHAGYPIQPCQDFSYYGMAADGLPQLLNDLQQAREFIFLEYFIISPGTIWDQILPILQKKVQEGVEVRIIYDDFGNAFHYPGDFARAMKKYGIEARAFNRIHPIIEAVNNNRDHRKIIVIDGQIAWSGGINLADEYFNIIERRGWWKDNLFRFRGPAVWTDTVLFLSSWNGISGTEEDFCRYRRPSRPVRQDGWICAFADDPFNDEAIGENLFLQLLMDARQRVWIFTPYLCLDQQVLNTLILATQRGIDVRLVLPSITDQHIVEEITRSYYTRLLQAGVRIFEYLPGYVHSKVFLCDSHTAVTGSFNLDYRSFFLHFENGVWLHDSSAVSAIAEDFLSVQNSCRELTPENWHPGLPRRILDAFLRSLAPLM